MLRPPENIQILADKWLAGTITPQEQQILDDWYEQQIPEKLTFETADGDEEALRNKLFRSIHERLTPDVPKIKPFRQKQLWISVAASLLLLALGGAYFFNYTPSQKPALKTARHIADKPPGGNKAVLKLADGSSIVLDSSDNGILAHQGGTVINKLNGGQLVYRSNTTAAPPANNLNTLTTPRGGQYKLQLPDGSKVWLNAASSLEFPAVFGTKERKVKLTGEAYFEIAKNVHKPFRVMLAKGAQVEVLGTHFNLMAYPDEQTINTTLLEGSVRVSKQANAIIIKPGEQAAIGETLRAYPVNTDEAVAWQKGDFLFSNADMATILRQLERWYDVRFNYTALPAKRLNGMVSRSYNLVQVLKMLEFTGGVKFRPEGKSIEVIY